MMLSTSSRPEDRFSSLTAVFTAALLVQFSTVPAFCPAMPPVKRVPRTTPEVWHREMVPPVSFFPAMPPT